MFAGSREPFRPGAHAGVGVSTGQRQVRAPSALGHPRSAMLAHPRDERVVLRRAHVHLALAQARALFPGSRLVFMFIRSPMRGRAREGAEACKTWDERPVRRTRAGIVVVLLHIRSAHVIFRAKADSTAGFKCDEVPSRLLVLVNKANKAESGHGAVSLRGLLQLFNRRPTGRREETEGRFARDCYGFAESVGYVEP